MSLDMVFDFMVVRLNPKNAEAKTIGINFDFTDTKEKYYLSLDNSVINYMADKQADGADATFTLKRTTLNKLMLTQITVEKAVADGQIKVDGDGQKLLDLLTMLDNFEFWFNLVTP
jgi:alkyl sulfatase BDS1-like metallo-beta-lactamase superfamily hydrolase